MRFKAVYEKGVGFNFPELAEDVQYEVWKDRVNKKFKRKMISSILLTFQLYPITILRRIVNRNERKMIQQRRLK